MDTLLKSIKCTAHDLQISRSEVYRRIAAKDLETVKIGRRQLVKTSSARRLAGEG